MQDCSTAPTLPGRFDGTCYDQADLLKSATIFYALFGYLSPF